MGTNNPLTYICKGEVFYGKIKEIIKDDKNK